MFLGGQPRLLSQGGEAPAFQYVWDPYLRPYALAWSNQFCYGNTMLGRSVFLGGQPRQPNWGCWAPASPKCLGPPTCAHTQHENSNQILHGTDNEKVRKNLHGPPCPLHALAKILGDTNADTRSVCDS